MDTVFDLFQEVDYDFLEVARGGITGNTVIKREGLRGVFKLRSGKDESPVSEMELRNSTATLHAHPEDYEDIDRIIGNGVRVDGVDYEIVSMTGGMNFDNGIMEHLTFSLQRADLTPPEGIR